MIAKKGIIIPIIVMSLFLIIGCGRDRVPKSNFQLGEEYFLASSYIKSMMRLEIWLREDDPADLQGKNSRAHAILAVMYYNDETRQKLFEAKFKVLKDMGEPGMAALLKLIETPTIASRLGNAINDILVMGGELSVPPLMAYMKGTNPRLRTYARSVLVNVGKAAVEPLIQLMDDPDPYSCSRAIEALSDIGDERAIKPLEGKLEYPNRLVQVQAAAALHKMGQKNPTQVIINALEDEDVQVRRVAARSIAVFVDNPPLKLMEKAAKDVDADVRNHAVISIGKIRSPESVQPLIKILVEDENDQVKASAADSLVKIGKPAVTPTIKLLEEARDTELTIRIVQVLGKLQDKKAVKPLEKIYNESTNTVLKNATAKALNMIP